MIGAQFTPNVPWAQKSFWTQRTVLLDDDVQMEARFGPFGNSAHLDLR
jgi:hypothetical protein